MLRNILGAVLGYIVTAVLTVVAIAAVWLAVGAKFAFREGTLEASTGWSLVMLVLGLLAAYVGGLTAAAIGRQGRGAAKILIGILLALGAFSAAVQLGKEVPELPPGTSIDDLGFVEAGQYARSPDWYVLLIPLVGALGVWLGGVRGRIEAVDNSVTET